MDTPTLRILQIDEKRVTTDLDRAGYRKTGVRMIQAASFLDAKSQLKKQDVDIIVINIDYEGISAEAACKHFKSEKETKDIPVVFTSIKSLPARLTKSNDGPDLCVEQPMPRQFFIEKLRTLLEQKIRDNSRVSYEGDACFLWNGEQRLCPILDLSKTGLLISCDLNLEPGQTIDLSFVLPSQKKAIKVTGEIVRYISPRASTQEEAGGGYGIKFKTFHGDSQKRLEKYMLKSATDDPKMVYYL
jgi:CheY-like chemotaxis protein